MVLRRRINEVWKQIVSYEVIMFNCEYIVLVNICISQLNLDEKRADK